MDFGLAGKVALVTGGGRGIGRAEALALAAEGVMVAVNALHANTCNETVAVVKAAGGQAEAYPADVSDEAAVIQMIDAITRKLGGLHILVNNAGQGGSHLNHTVDQMPTESWDAIMGSHLRGTFLCSKHALPSMKAAGFGRIVNTSSVHALSGGRPGIANYTSAKAGVIGFTRNLAKDVGRYGVTANAVAPGFVATEFIGSYPETFLRRVREQNPLGRLCEPEELGALVCYLCSKQAAFINGAVIAIDGGRREYYLP